MSKLCKKCGNKIPNRVEINGKIRNFSKRKFCLKCSPFNKHNTRNLSKPTVEIDGKLKTVAGQSQARSRRRKKKKAIEYAGGKCSICGYDRCQAALEFHHPDPKGKEADPSQSVYLWSWKRAKIEIDKCLLVCSNCHREIHYGLCKEEKLERKIRPTCRVLCPVCNLEFQTKDENQVFCTHKCAQVSSRRVERPDKKTLDSDIKEMSWLSVGHKYGVSDNAVRKWARSYGLI